MLTLKEMRIVARELSFVWNKKLGQNFLHDLNILKYIINLATNYKAEIVLEIGAGMGNLTELLAENFPEVIAVEIDRKLSEYLKTRFKDKGIQILHADALKLDFKKILKKRALCVSNIPYYISTPIIFKLLKNRKLFESIILMVQKEVADKLLSGPSTKEYGPLSIYAQLTSSIKRLKKVSRHSFFPEPEVDSCIVELRPLSNENLERINEEEFLAFLQMCFSTRRKTILNNIKRNLPGINTETLYTILDAINISIKSRAEEITPYIWLKLFENLFPTNLVL